MDISSISGIAKSGMDLERNRVELASMKLALANSGFSSSVEASNAAEGITNRVFSELLTAELPTVNVKTVHDPEHPNANVVGDVFYFDIDPIHEMATLVSALRSYEANVRAYNTNSEMNQAALSIGKNQ